MSIIFLILGIIGLSIPTYFGLQTLISVILIVIGGGWLLIFGVFFLITIFGAGTTAVSAHRGIKRRGNFW